MLRCIQCMSKLECRPYTNTRGDSMPTNERQPNTSFHSKHFNVVPLSWEHREMYIPTADLPSLTEFPWVSRNQPWPPDLTEMFQNLTEFEWYFIFLEEIVILAVSNQNGCLCPRISLNGAGKREHENKNSPTTNPPPPLNRVGFGRLRKNSATTPPSPTYNRVGLLRSRKNPATTPLPPLNRVDFWRSRKRLKKLNKFNLAALLQTGTIESTNYRSQPGDTRSTIRANNVTLCQKIATVLIMRA